MLSPVFIKGLSQSTLSSQLPQQLLSLAAALRDAEEMQLTDNPGNKRLAKQQTQGSDTGPHSLAEHFSWPEATLLRVLHPQQQKMMTYLILNVA